MDLLATLIDNYDLSDIINQGIITLLVGMLLIQYRVHFQTGKTQYDY